MIKLHPSSTPFFARIKQADLACPRCDFVTQFGGPNKRNAKRAHGNVWNRTTCRWKCPRCELTLRLGIVAHPVAPKTRFMPAVDAVPNLKQALELRNQVSRMAPERVGGGLAEVNRVGEEQAWVPEDEMLTRPGDVRPGTAEMRSVPERARKANYWGPRQEEQLNHSPGCPRHDGLRCTCPKGDERPE